MPAVVVAATAVAAAATAAAVVIAAVAAATMEEAVVITEEAATGEAAAATGEAVAAIRTTTTRLSHITMGMARSTLTRHPRASTSSLDFDSAACSTVVINRSTYCCRSSALNGRMREALPSREIR
jgi:hypothetical protein